MSKQRLTRLRNAAIFGAALLLLAGCKSMLTSGNEPSISGVAPVNSSAIDAVEREIGRKEHPKIVKAYGGVYQQSTP